MAKAGSAAVCRAKRLKLAALAVVIVLLVSAETAMSFLKKLFGGTKAAGAATRPAAEAEYEGYTIIATPQPEGGQYRLHGTISREVAGEMNSHTLIRADLFPDADQCAEVTIRKAKQVIDEQGERLFG